MGDERAFQRNLAAWQTLYRPLASARGPELSKTLERIAGESERLEKTISFDGEMSFEDWKRWNRAEDEARAALERVFKRANPRERRAMLRVYGIIGSAFRYLEIPYYPSCGTAGEGTPFYMQIRGLFGGAVAKEPAAYLGLLDDPDPRIAELAADSYRLSHPDEVRTRVMRWRRSPQARFRAISAVWVSHYDVYWPFFEADEVRTIVNALLDDPVEAIRKEALKRLPEGEMEAAYLERYPVFNKALSGAKWTTLWLGLRLDRSDVLPLARASFLGEKSVVRMALEVIAAKDPDPEMRTSAERRLQSLGEE